MTSSVVLLIFDIVYYLPEIFFDLRYEEDLMKPYIGIDGRCTFANKLKRINHEFFHRPRMALSMMAQSLMENKERVLRVKKHH